jgi:uncharacterized protein
MNKELISVLQQYFSNKPVLKAYLFGSVVRNENRPESDIDILVELDYANGANYFTFFDMREQLTGLLNKKVDLVSDKGISRHIRPIIDKEKQLVYER